ncbi:hypothetical protein LCGC14_2055040 [marine sediment metagenome]|uniref:Uncharacterized protein n=1 Tax=marine sediment metagenome TaxID=412755 RepID=A0A0F9EMY9_9ZZZZ
MTCEVCGEEIEAMRHPSVEVHILHRGAFKVKEEFFEYHTDCYPKRSFP